MSWISMWKVFERGSESRGLLAAEAAEAFLAYPDPAAVISCTGDRLPAAGADLVNEIGFADKGPRKRDKISPPFLDDLLHEVRGTESTHQTQRQLSHLWTNGFG